MPSLSTAKSALEVAAEDYLLKPLSIDQALKVLQAVEQKLERRGMRQNWPH